MGYMGFGLQKWIYTMRPRQFMSRRRKPDAGGAEGRAGLDINDYIKVKYNKLDFKTKKEVAPEVRLIIREKIRLDRKLSVYKQIVALFISLIIMGVIVYFVTDYNQNYYKKEYLFKSYYNEDTKVNTKYTFYKDYDKLESIENFKNGKREGSSIYYDFKNDNILSIENYSNDILISKTDFYNNKNYKIIYQIDVDGKIYHGKGYDFQGNLIFEGDIDYPYIYIVRLKTNFINYKDYRD